MLFARVIYSDGRTWPIRLGSGVVTVEKDQMKLLHIDVMRNGGLCRDGTS
jgi:hypothetical protein